MTKRILLFPCLIIVFLCPLFSAPQAGQGCSACSLAQRALKDAQGLKAGMTRKDIEAHNFTLAGGMTFRSPTTYAYKDCDYIQLEIEFHLDPTVQQEFSTRDVIKRVSRLMIDYPAKD